MDPLKDNGPTMNMPPEPLEVPLATPPPLQMSTAVEPGVTGNNDSSQQSAAAAWLPPSVPVQPSAQGASGSSDGSMSVTAPAIADDADVIEKEWVLKAKEIVNRTKQDPHLQTKELHKFKAEYMKKRYNKTIQPVEE